MELKFIDNQEIKLSAVLVPEIRESLDTRIAVAFVSASGLSVIEQPVLEALSSSGQIEMLVGLDFATTEPKALWMMHRWAEVNKTFIFYCLPLSRNIYHPKMYLMAQHNSASLVVGSSNLTLAGLSRNAEANIFIKDNADAEVFTDAQASCVRLKFDGRRVPDEEFLSAYEAKSIEFSVAEKKNRSRNLGSLYASLKDKFVSLPTPSPTSKDLSGWLRLVYERLPEGDFTNEDMYQYEEYFQSEYPENRNVRHKIRQQLQYLRDIGLVEHISRGSWQKVQNVSFQ